jgi:hypothetical protein
MFANVRRTRPCHHFSSDMVHKTLNLGVRREVPKSMNVLSKCNLLHAIASVKPERTFLV